MRLSIVINTFDRPATLRCCLECVAAQPQPFPFEIIVVDDGGRLDPAPALEPVRSAHPALSLRLLRIAHAGRAAARNHGVSAASGERILFLGDDVMAGPVCLARHAVASDSRTALVGPYPWVTLDGSPPFRRWAEPNPQNDIDDPLDAGFMHFATGNLSIDRGMFLQLGGFSEAYTLYGWEDLDLGLRFERAGGRLVFDRTAAAEHHHPRMTRAALWRREYEMGYTAWQFAERWRRQAPDAVRRMVFWDNPAALKPGPAWRRLLGGLGITLLDHFAPGGALNRRLYERMVFAARYRGVYQAWLDAGGRTGPQAHE